VTAVKEAVGMADEAAVVMAVSRVAKIATTTVVSRIGPLSSNNSPARARSAHPMLRAHQNLNWNDQSTWTPQQRADFQQHSNSEPL